jgi:hypothetical protein
MRKIFFAVLLALAINISSGKAQTPPTTYTIVAVGALANCAPVVVGQTQYCFPVEGLAVSVKGAAYVLVPLTTPVAGIQSIKVCNVPGTTCNTPLTGSTVTLNIPQTVTLTVPTVTSTATAPTATLQ